MEKIVKTHRIFDKHYEKRILTDPQLDAKFQERLKLFINDPKNPILNDHPLTGKKKEFRSFSVTGNTRVIY